MGEHGGFSVLLVEDDKDHALLAHVAFSYVDPSAEVTVAATAEDAISHLQAKLARAAWRRTAALPDVIVLDLNMPGMGGIGFLEWYSAEPRVRGVPVIVLTSMGTELAERCLELGAKDYIVKTANFAALVARVRRIVQGPDAHEGSCEAG